MPAATKDLSALASVLELNVDSGTSGKSFSRGTFHYIAGTGTIALEATLQNSDPANWFLIQDDAGVDIVASTAAGDVINFALHGYIRIRAVNTLAGVGNLVSLGFN